MEYCMRHLKKFVAGLLVGAVLVAVPLTVYSQGSALRVFGPLQIWDTVADAYPSIQVSGSTGVISSGSGAAAPSSAITLGASGAVTFGVDPTLSSGDSLSALGEKVITKAYGQTVAEHVSDVFFIVEQNYTVTGVDVAWTVAETTGAMDVQVQRLQGTEACASGDDLLASVVDATGTANTVAAATLTSTSALLNLSDGERVCVELSASPNEVKGLVVSVRLALR
jgi:hypothetical protein